MTADDKVPDEWLIANADILDLSDSDAAALARSVTGDPDIVPWRPESRIAVDPRTGLPVVFSPARARRPHDHPPSPPPPPEVCVVCAGRTTKVVDIAPLSQGKTFINSNLFPVVYPGGGGDETTVARGAHLLQWVSTEHDVDLHNIAPADLAIVLERLGVLEDSLYRDETMPEVGGGRRGHVIVMKNVGRLVGGSVEHGHHQIVQTSVRPRALGLDADFLAARGEPFATFLLRESPDDLIVRDYDGRFRLLVPYFMPRPFDMTIVPLAPGPVDLRDLDGDERLALARALRDAAAAVTAILPEIGREVAWNLAVHNGIAGGLYIEVLPWSQERGGCEILGLNLSEGWPPDVAARVRAFLDEEREA